MLYVRFTPTGPKRWTAIINSKRVATITLKDGARSIHTRIGLSRREMACVQDFANDMASRARS